MYPTLHQATELLTTVQQRLADRVREAVPRVIVCPPFPCLPALADVLDRRFFRLGGQNCHWESSGPYTGEVSPLMLSEMADYVLLGHSDRRTMGETDAQIAWKVRAAVAAGLTPVLFVGEDEPTDVAIYYTERRLGRGLAEVDLSVHDILVVYEPTWAIGVDNPADPEHVREVVTHLKNCLSKLGARKNEIIYGGTVTADNVGQFTGIDVLDGVGATRATLDENSFLRIIDQVAAADAGSAA